ncbi:MAG: exonuclease SbcCD subunit D C-terminal domain-containing protein [Campylobacterota bacterium]
MKLLHTSDWHLGQNFMGQSRQAEHEAFLAWLLETIKENGVDALIVAGDIFDTATPPNYALQLYYNFLKELSMIECLNTTIITAGNHDSVATLRAPKQLLQALNVHVITSGESDEDIIIPIIKEEKTKAIVCAVPFLRDSVIRQSLSGETVSQKEKQANVGIKRYYQEAHDKAKESQNGSDIPIIATGHLTTLGGKTSESEREIYIGTTLDIGGDYLGRLFDYVALGHLHSNQKVGVEHVRYSGSPIPLSFSEASSTKKVNLVSFEKNVAVKEIEIPQLRKLIVLKGNAHTVIQKLQEIEDHEAWIEVHLSDDNPYIANQEVRQKAQELELTLLAVKVQKSEKQLRSKQMQAISLDELTVAQVFERRMQMEQIEDAAFEKQLWQSFGEIAEKVQNR